MEERERMILLLPRLARVNGGEGEDDTAAAAAGEGEWRRGRG